MNIRNRKELGAFAAQRLQNAPQNKTIVAIFAAVIIGLSLLSAGVNYVLNLQMNQSGGLSKLGTRSVLSALQTMLPIVQSVVVLCLELGYLAAMLRIARGQYVSPNTLRLGFDRFWVLLRYTLLKAALLMGVGFVSIYAGVMLFMLTPFSEPITELLAPLVSQSTLLDPSIVIPDALYDSLLSSMLPAFLICGILYLIAAVPLLYRLRMTPYILIDKPGMGALAAMRQSRSMMYRNGIPLFRLDLHLWWFYAASVVASALCYGDQILLLLGVELPFSPTVSFFLFYALYWAAEFLLLYYLRNHVEVTYALAYDSLLPKEENTGSVVLGNIFQM